MSKKDNHSINRKYWWIVEGIEKGKRFYYSASNAPTKKLAMMHHTCSLGILWGACVRQGDRLVKVQLTEMPKSFGK